MWWRTQEGCRRVPLSRRALLRSSLTLPALAVMGGCRPGRGTVRVGVVWSGWELDQFRRVLESFTVAEGWGVTVRSVGDDIDVLLGNQVAQSAAVDVALVPRPGLVREHRDRLVTLEPDVATPYPPAWRDLLAPGGEPLGVWFKGAHKSLVWYRRNLFDAQGLEPPTDWNGWVVLNQRLVELGVAPLAVGAADGWVLTDWFENVLLGIDPDAYQDLAQRYQDWDRPAVRQTLEELARIWAQPGALAGGVHSALGAQFEESVVEVFARGRAAMVAGSDFAWPVIARLRDRAQEPDWFPFPAPAGRAPPEVVGGDAAVQLSRDHEGAQALIGWLAAPEAAEVWASAGGFVSLHRDVDPAVYPDVYRDLPEQVRAGRVYFDLSDQLPGPLSGGDGRGLWRLLQEFLGEVAIPGRSTRAVAAAVERTIEELDVEAARLRP